MRTGSTRRWRARTEKWERSGEEPDSGCQAGDPAAADGGRAQGQDGQPDVRGPAAGRPAAHGLRAADVSDELGQGRASPDTVRCFRRRWAAAPLAFGGRNGGIVHAAGRLGFAAAHGLAAGQAVTCGGEIRFVAAIVDATTVQSERAVRDDAAGGRGAGATMTYMPATELPSVSIFDYWSPATAVQRLLRGAAVDQMEILVNGDYHEAHFKGIAQDVLDSATFSRRRGAVDELPGGAGAGGRSTTRLCRGTWDRRGWGRRRRSSSR